MTGSGTGLMFKSFIRKALSRARVGHRVARAVSRIPGCATWPAPMRKLLRGAAGPDPGERNAVRAAIRAYATANGLEAAAAHYAEQCRRRGYEADTVVAPVASVRDWARQVGLEVLEAGEIEAIPFKPPHVWGRPPAATPVFAASNRPYVADLANVRIVGNSSLILTPDGTALSDTGGHPTFGHIVDFVYEPIVLAQRPGRVLLDFGGLRTRTIDAGMWLSGLASWAFGHWLPEFLPKLQFLRRHPDFDDLPIIVDADMPQSHFDHLRRLAPNPLIKLRTGESFVCRRLLVAPSPTFLPVEIFPHDIPMHELPGLSPQALRFLRAGRSYESETAGRRRIFLARKNMRWRRLLNEEEIVADLARLGFETVYLEQLSMAEQMELLQQTQWIVAPNGSAILNLIFADTRTRLLVLSQPNLANWGSFQGPMDSLGYRTMFVCGDYARDQTQKHSDYHVPTTRIRGALAELGLPEAA